LPDSEGIDTFLAVHSARPLVPVVILSANDAEDVALEAMKGGAQDYLIKGEMDGKPLPHILRNNFERIRRETKLNKMSFVDDLTGLYNRRGFLTFADQHMKLTERTQKGFLMMMIDVDGLKKINDTMGHQMGDQAIRDVSDILRDAFRKSDIVSRLGGDEFAVLAIDAHSQAAHVEIAEKLKKRLFKKLDRHNQKSSRDYTLSFSVGYAYYDPAHAVEIEALLKKADQVMYKEKRQRAGARNT